MSGRRLRQVLALTLASGALLGTPAHAQLPLPTPLPPPIEPEPEPDPQPPSQPPNNPPRQPTPPADAPVGTPIYRGDAAHRGWAPDRRLIPPLQRRWIRSFDYSGNVVYGDGRLYIWASNRLRALSPRTGRQLWATRGDYGGQLLAYANHRVYAAYFGASAYDASSGRRLWHTDLGNSTDAPPVPYGDTVYIEAGGTLYALDAATGEVRWQHAAYADGDAGAPAVGGSMVYRPTSCHTRALDVGDGSTRWRDSKCRSGVAGPAVLYRDRVYASHSGSFYDALGGARLGGFPGTGPPAFAGDFGVFHRGGRLWTANLRNRRRIWSARLPRAYGNPGALNADQVLIVGPTVYSVVNTQVTRIQARLLRSGTYVWQARPPRPLGDYTPTRLAAAPGLLVASTNGKVAAYESVFRPRRRGVGFGTYATDLFLGERVVMVGVMGRALREGPPPTRIQADPVPFGRFREIERFRFDEDGWFGFIQRPRRNTRYRAAVRRVRSRPVTVYTYPRFRIRVRGLGRTHFVTSVRFGHARGLRLGGRRGYVYFTRRRGGIGRRLGSGLIRQRRGVVSYRVVARRQRASSGHVAVCIYRQSRLGLGRPIPLFKHCGRARLRTP